MKTARQDAEQTWGDLGLQLSGICGVCICSFYLVLGGEKEEERRSGEEEKSNNPNLKGGEQWTPKLNGTHPQVKNNNSGLGHTMGKQQQWKRQAVPTPCQKTTIPNGQWEIICMHGYL